jgi:hypothetical protein
MTNSFFKKGPSFKPEIATGKCPTCHEFTMLVSITRDFYRCITCGADLEQKINGVIKYIPFHTKPYSPENKSNITNG